MKWTLLFWIYACAGIDCPIPEYEQRTFNTEAECNTALEFWVKTSPSLKKQSSWVNGKQVTKVDKTGQHRGICLEGKFEQGQQ